MKQWLKPLIVRYWKEKRINKKTILQEIDKRFMYVTAYPRLRRFSSGIFTEDHHWTMREYKDIMRVTPAVLHGICPSEGMKLLREYLHIHRLSHYTVHTETSLNLLDSAIHSFWRILKDPNGRFMQWNIWTKNDDYAQPRLHYFSHYAYAVHEKGCLPGCSTDRTEPLHKYLKEFYQKSNKGADYDLFLLRSESKLAAFKTMINKLEEKIPWEKQPKRVSKRQDKKRFGLPREDEYHENGESKCENAVEEFELPPPESHDTVLSITQPEIPPDSITWPSKCRHGWPTTIQHTATKLGCDGFLSSLHLFISKSPLSHNAFHDISNVEQVGSLQIGVVNFIKRKYNVNAIYGAEISGTFAEAWNNVTKVDVISAGPEKGRRRDCVLVECISGESRARELNTMTN